MLDERDDREMGGRAALEAERSDARLAGVGGGRRPNKTMADAPVGLLAPPQRGERPIGDERPAPEPNERPAAEPKERPASEPKAPPSESEAKPGEPSQTGGESPQGMAAPASGPGAARPRCALAGGGGGIPLLGLYLAFRVDGRRLHRSAPVRHRAPGRGLRHGGSGHRQPACQQGRRDRPDRPARLPRGARAGRRSGGGRGSRHPQHRRADRDARRADRRQPGAGGPGAGEPGTLAGHLGTRQAARQSGLGDGSAGHD